MGQKTHPIGFRLGIIKDWQAKWYAAKGSQYRELLQEDLSIRNAIRARLPEAGISKVELERGAQELVVTIHSARPGIVIGRGGQRVEEVRQVVEGLTHKRARLNVQEVRQPELDAQLVAASIAEQLGRRGRLPPSDASGRQPGHAVRGAGHEGDLLRSVGWCGDSRREKVMQGRVPLHTLRADIDYGLAEARTTMGRIGVKVWVYKGDILPEPKVIEAEPDAEELQMIEVTVGGETNP